MKIFAKCNLSLNVLGTRADGYHELDMAVCSVSVADEIFLTERRDREIRCAFPGVPEEKNAAIAAARAFRARAEAETGERLPGWEIEIRKGIPFCAGLGGSSADAAGVLRLLGEKYLHAADLSEIASSVGSDTAYMLGGGFARLGGKGERIRPFSCPKKLYFVFLVARGGVSTAAAFSRVERCAPSDNEGLIAKLCTGDLAGASAEMKNGLFGAAADLNPAVRKSAARLCALEPAPLCVNMTGSGGGLYALYADAESAKTACANLGADAFLAESV